MDLTQTLPSDFWALILAELQPLSFQSWRSFRLVSKFWQAIVSTSSTSLTLCGSSDIQKATSNDLEQFGRNLLTLSIESSLTDRLKLEQGEEIWLRGQDVDSLATLDKIESFSLSDSELMFSSRQLFEVCLRWTNLRILKLKSDLIADWDQLYQLFAALNCLTDVSLQLPCSIAPEASIDSNEAMLQVYESIQAERLSTLEVLGEGVSEFCLTRLSLNNLVALTISHRRLGANELIPRLSLLESLKSLTLIRTAFKLGNSVYEDADACHLRLLPELEHLHCEDCELPVYLGTAFSLPKLKKLVTVGVPMIVPPYRQDDGLPPPRNTQIESWTIRLPKGLVIWSMAVFQLLPALRTFKWIGMFPWNFSVARTWFDQLPVLEHLSFKSADRALSLKQLTTHGRATFWNRIKCLCLRNSPSISGLQVLGSLRYLTLTRLDLQGCRQTTDEDISTIAPSCSALRYLNLKHCAMIGVTSFKCIAKSWIMLEHLNISYTQLRFVTHLRLLEPLKRLKFLGCCGLQPKPTRSTVECASKVNEFAVLTGMWPCLISLQIDASFSLQHLAESFGPLVSVKQI